jgi:hypothetical protein
MRLSDHLDKDTKNKLNNLTDKKKKRRRGKPPSKTNADKLSRRDLEEYTVIRLKGVEGL